ncbi:MAG TPA: phosphotransferase family protein [Rhizomicrobium sp.]|nr:phosphotransferase family protein [Rhizomicrobium sp.]
MNDTLPGIANIENLKRLSGGASQETWSFDAVVSGAVEPLILRRRPGNIPRGGNSVSLATEAHVIEAARRASVKAPRVRCVLKPEDGIGEAYVMDRLEGETIARKILRDEAFANVRPKLARQCGETLARIHAVNTEPLRDALQTMDGRTQLSRYRDLYDAYDYPHPIFELAFQWLEPRLKESGSATLVHGDFRNGNLLISPGGIEAVLDWELTHIGDPLEDIGWICVNSWRFGVSEKLVSGFGDLGDLLEAYVAAGGARFTPDDVKPWIVFGSLKWGIMCMTMYQGFRADGSVERAAIGRRASEAEIDLVNLLIRDELKP